MKKNLVNVEYLFKEKNYHWIKKTRLLESSK